MHNATHNKVSIMYQKEFDNRKVQKFNQLKFNYREKQDIIHKNVCWTLSLQKVTYSPMLYKIKINSDIHR